MAALGQGRNMDPIYILVGCAVLSGVLASWVVWLAGRRLFNPKVRVSEKVFALSMVGIGGVISLVGLPIFGLPVVASGIGTLAINQGSGTVAGGGVGAGGGGGCGGGTGGC